MSYEPKPSLPRHIHSPVEHYDVDVETGTVTYRVVRTNGDRIRSMSDEDLMRFLLRVGTLENRPWCDDEPCNNRYCSECITEWLKEEAKDG